jgi:glycosyltransferase involved in cell wall biosynthesis
MMQYLPWLVSAGVDVTVAPFFSDTYVLGLQQNNRRWGDVVQAYAGRIKSLLRSTSFDLIWIEKEIFPWLPAWVEQALLSSRVPYVLDYDDAVFHYYDLHRNSVVRALLGDKHPEMMRSAALVIAGNAYLASYANQAGAKHIEVVPTVIDLDRYPMQTHPIAPTMPPCVGWVGQRATESFLVPFQSLFERLVASGVARFSAIGIDARSLGLAMESVPWTEQTEVESIASFDIGIMPLVDEPFERGKCGYKLIQYMACGLPVVASPVGVNRQLVEHGVNGFLAETADQWEQALQTLLADGNLRQRMGKAGRLKVEQQFCIQVTGPKLAVLLATAF